VVMLDADCSFRHLDGDGLEIHWGAYLGMDDEILVSGRLDEVGPEIERLRADARERKGWIMDAYLLRRCVAEEGTRHEEHPLITFRDGPTGRRAGLLGGPDVWEIAMWAEDLAAEPDPVTALAEDSGLTRSQIDAALRYRAAYPDEVAARIELHRRETADAEKH
jgi:hypothetical protein